MIAPDMETEQSSPTKFPTYLQAVKCRQDSSVTRHAARIEYDVRRDAYEDHYVLGRLAQAGREFIPLDRDQWPAWKHDTQGEHRDG
jgi:hypothetical protein